MIDSEQGNKRISEKDILPPDPRKITLYITDAHKIIEQIPVELLSKGCKRLDSIASYNYLIEHPEINISSTATPYVSKADIVMNDSKLYIKTDPTAWFLELLRMIFLAHILFST
ncbi:MAG: hypothetical protein A3J10_02165 [Candidatus Sungbacteria bacterium RIFCSPLOWO2_02_FULL_54_10]|uniref:Uncharacterized protein n=1 Tax=Candidatus Sungbacteria bacterium RIFCSPLOWO2_01_FULL_54_21 TaxID=1802279 RepID=A0A1G2L4V8_9BACT|nr:MAG: hypothetical protein A2679_01915 [Candidatus Sungbacteria bacterium RIFCSPHIGHO2_01_FULL_54_26]OHA06610.1 MAG: hypothetical protein A3B34_03830 [Candidatus Sungbacteria bacterium RIFCSPLOWO2_01_FULL_54_21]OHA12441.1 MAG: hypothetical protein A3J10_02165 [Candidatus Sungbacteria bacterium RIFCSPLOWO2_02_FULL_54_10]